MGAGRLALAAVCLVATGAACTDDVAPARAQVLLIVDTNVPLVGQLALRDELARDTAIDTVRIEVFDDGGALAETRDFIVPDPSSWPLSLGLRPRSSTTARLRLRAFRAIHAQADKAGAVAIAPPQLVIDRMVAITSPAEGMRTLRVTLEGDCLGMPAATSAPFSSCVDAATPSAEPTVGIDIEPGLSARTTTRAGTWQGATFVDCTAARPNDDAICIPGGFTILGEATLSGIEGAYEEAHDSAPIRPVRLSPFYLDKYEFTVGRLRKSGVAALGDEEEPFVPGRPANADCTFRGFDDGVNDALPLNCVHWKSARKLCRASGGDLPTEAQWEYTARGRGEQRPFPWGSGFGGCCTSSLERATRGVFNGCGRGVEPVGSHADPSRCSGFADVSRDGVVDLGGSLNEFLRDVFQPYTAACWGGAGIALDPTCRDDESQDHMIRGASWKENGLLANTTVRASNGPVFEVQTGRGFRCAYPGVAP